MARSHWKKFGIGHFAVGPFALGMGLFAALAACSEDGGDTMVIDPVDASAQAACADGVDNDLDGLIDLADPGCTDAADDDEEDPLLGECEDGVDNDDDGLIDGADPGCAQGGDDESADPPVAQCADGIDNDDDGDIDLVDRGCASSRDNDESDEPPLPACNNGIDDDVDGFTDFPSDPGCGSEFDDDETDTAGPPVPQCGDSVDNDDDGLVDLADPGCTSPADPREADPPPGEEPVCYNLIDDDNDGIVDFPNDPGCSSAGDGDEADLPQPPQCGNGLDDDGDGAIDYPNDPGCAGVGDRDETDPPIPPACSDGQDNDRDGRIDYPDDRGCSSAADATETGNCGRTYDPAELEDGRTIRGDSRRGAFASEGTCGGRGAPEVAFLYRVERPLEALVITTAIEGNEVETTLYVRRGCLNSASEIACVREPLNDDVAANELVISNPLAGDYYIFLDGASGRGGEFALRVDEVPLAACLNGLDDDGDGVTDFPEDPGCAERDDRDETDPDPLPECANGEDDDGDGAIDFPLDFGCRAAGDDDEVDLCGQGVRVFEYPVGRPSIMDDTSMGGADNFSGSCGGAGGQEKVYVYSNPFNSRLTFSVANPGTVNNATLYVRSQCNAGGTELACDVGADLPNRQGTVELERVPPGDVYVFVDILGLGGQFQLSVDVERLPPGCADQIDNDEDGFTDLDDIGCSSAMDEDERDPAGPPPACWDGLDNDDDGIIDYPFDPGCFGKGDNDEADPAVLPQCANGIDDDEDDLVDFPADSGCPSRGHDQERNPNRNAECTNRIDDDQDGFTDFPNDPGCSAPGDRSEQDDARRPACFDGEDNDRDGIIDYPYDRGCAFAADPDETDPEVPAACSNRVDDDGDGIIDFPRDPGCTGSGDEDETNPAFLPPCANGRDDDNDGLIDFPDDRGCRFAADVDELGDFNAPPRCVDGVDDDGDGLVDLNDPGCENRLDNDESDEPEVPECGDGIDNDEDGALDWPADPGCQAFGDVAESQACVGDPMVPTIRANGRVMSSTVEGGEDNYRSRCGGRDAPDEVFRYVLAEAGDLRISADNPGTDYPVVLSVFRDCEEPLSMVACAGDFANPNPEVLMRDAPPGEYYIYVDGGGPERWVGAEAAVIMPNDPRAFVARNDFDQRCWGDGGNDAFDCFGLTTLTVNGAVSPELNVSPNGAVVAGNVGGYAFNYRSQLIHTNVWRFSMTPAIENDETPVTFRVAGNLGSDGSASYQLRNTPFQGRNVDYLFSSDGQPSDPPIVFMVIPGDPEQLNRVTYTFAPNNDNPVITATDVTLPLTFYLALSYADSAAVSQALTANIEIQAGGGGAEAPRFGNFELSVTEE